MHSIFNALHTSIDAGTVILLVAIGELLLERTGVLNLGLEGIVAMGAVAAVIATGHFGSPVTCLLVAILTGAVIGTLFGLITVVVRANQVLTGLGLVLLGVGLANRIGTAYTGTPVKVTFHSWKVPGLHEIPYIGNALFNHDPIVYITYLALPAVASYVLFRTRHGLNMRAIGENAAAIRSVKIQTRKIPSRGDSIEASARRHPQPIAVTLRPHASACSSRSSSRGSSVVGTRTNSSAPCSPSAATVSRSTPGSCIRHSDAIASAAAGPNVER